MKYSSIDEQLKLLREQKLIIPNEKFARDCLYTFGYSNIIKSYREPYTVSINEKIQYRAGVTFDQIFSLYFLDKQLRTAVFASMLDLEECFKSIVADIIAANFGIEPDSYLEFRKYRDKKKRNKNFSLKNILNTLRALLNTDKNPIAHYRDVHKVVPPWILFKSAYFSTIVNLVHYLPTELQYEIAARMLSTNLLDENNVDSREFLKDSLSIFLEYRNLAAHGGRIYNYNCKCTCRALPTATGFNLLMNILNIYTFNDPSIYIENTLNAQVNRHCCKFPEDVTYLSNILKIDIESHRYAWISGKNKIVHSNQFCSGMKNAQQIDINDIPDDYILCKKCFIKN